MKKIVCVVNIDKVELLDELGFKSCGKRDIGDKVAFQYVLTEKLYKVLNDKSLFSKRDYFEDVKLTF